MLRLHFHSSHRCLGMVCGLWTHAFLMPQFVQCRQHLSYKYCPCLQVLCSIDSIVHSPRAPGVIYKQSKERAQNRSKDAVQECGFEYLVPVIEMWADELTSLKVRSRIVFICLENLLGLAFVVLHKAKKPHFSKIEILLLSYFVLICF